MFVSGSKAEAEVGSVSSGSQVGYVVVSVIGSVIGSRAVS